jgi:hypothetical protein
MNGSRALRGLHDGRAEPRPLACVNVLELGRRPTTTDGQLLILSSCCSLSTDATTTDGQLLILSSCCSLSYRTRSVLLLVTFSRPDPRCRVPEIGG